MKYALGFSFNGDGGDGVDYWMQDNPMYPGTGVIWDNDGIRLLFDTFSDVVAALETNARFNPLRMVERTRQDAKENRDVGHFIVKLDDDGNEIERWGP